MRFKWWFRNLKKNYALFENTYFENLVIITINWIVWSYKFFLLLFMTKYFEGSIYLNYYLDGAAGIIGSSIVSVLYGCFRMKIRLIITILFAEK